MPEACASRRATRASSRDTRASSRDTRVSSRDARVTTRDARVSVSAMRAALVPAIVLAALALSAPAFAQFKWIGADGAVTYGDRPPPGARLLGQPAAAAPAVARAGNGAALPYELRTAAQRHPVVLYLAVDCQPCEQAREHLSRRGIPHEAREVRTQRDADAFRKLGFQALSFPAVSIGSERLTGYEASSWDRSLDAAGYPTESRLPRNWRLAQPEPLTAPEPAVVSLQAPASAQGVAGANPADTAGTNAGTADQQSAAPSARSPVRQRASVSAAANAEPPLRF